MLRRLAYHLRELRLRGQRPLPARNLTTDVLSGMVVGVVLIPTSMAYGIIAGVGPAAGLYGAIAIGLVAAIAGGTRALISGPNVFVAVVMTPVVAEYGIEGAFAAALLTGLIMVALGVLRVGRFIAYVPHSLLSGFYTAAGILLIATQVLPAMGLPTAPGGIVANAREWLGATVNHEALAVAAITIAAGFAWPRRLGGYVPSQFVALLAGTAAGTLWLSDAPVIGDIPRGLPELQLPALELAIITPAFTMAVLSAATTLITALQTDAITGGSHKPNRELVAQGLGNVTAGMIGGSAGGVSSTSLINAHAGGRTMVAGITAAAILIVSLVALQAIHVPLAALAGIIMVTGYRIIDWRFLGRLHRIPRSYSFVMLTTVCIAVLADFVTAILIGLVVSALVGASRSERHELERLISVPLLDRMVWPEGDPYSSRVGLIILPETIPVASAREVARVLRGETQSSEILILDFARTAYVDDTAAVLIGQAITGKQAVMAGLHGDAAATLSGFTGALEHQAVDLAHATAMARELIESRG